MRILMSLILLLGALQLPAQEPKINKRPIKQTSAASGKEMFASYCSACHGAGGKGDGPAASAFINPFISKQTSVILGE